jgi:hypothetical protein
LHWIERRVAGASVMQGCIFVPILLIFQAYGDRVGHLQDMERRVVWDDCSHDPKLDVLLAEWYCLSLFPALGVLSHP